MGVQRKGSRKDINALSYGTIQLHRENIEGTLWKGFYVRLEINSSEGKWSEILDPIPYTWQRLHPKG